MLIWELENLEKIMDYWRKKYFIQSIKENQEIALIGIGDLDAYMKMNNNERVEKCDAFRLHYSGCKYDLYDISERLVQKVRLFSMNAHVLDVTKKPLNKKYDIIFASDVIEHTYSPVNFLLNISKSLKEGGKMVITTPNALYWRQFIRTSEFHEHMQTFNTENFKNLAKLLKLEIIELASFQTISNKNNLIRRISNFISVLFAKHNRANSLIFVAKVIR